MIHPKSDTPARSASNTRVHSALRADGPRWLAFAQGLAEEIASGRRGVGDLLPTETELCEQSGLSRYAVRQAVDRLIALGLVSRHPGIGTRVIMQHPSVHYAFKMSDLRDLTQYAQDTEFSIDARQSIDARMVQHGLLDAAADQKWLHLSGIRRTKGGDLASAAIAVVNIYVLQAYSRLAGLKSPLKTPVYTLIEQQHGLRVTRVDQQISGQVIGAADARALGVKPGSSGLLIVRRYYVDAALIEVTTGLHPSARFSHTMSFHLV